MISHDIWERDLLRRKKRKKMMPAEAKSSFIDDLGINPLVPSVH